MNLSANLHICAAGTNLLCKRPVYIVLLHLSFPEKGYIILRISPGRLVRTEVKLSSIYLQAIINHILDYFKPERYINALNRTLKKH